MNSADGDRRTAAKAGSASAIDAVIGRLSHCLRLLDQPAASCSHGGPDAIVTRVNEAMRGGWNWDWLTD